MKGINFNRLEQEPRTKADKGDMPLQGMLSHALCVLMNQSVSVGYRSRFMCWHSEMTVF